MHLTGFSKLSKEDKIDLIVRNYLGNSTKAKSVLQNFWLSDNRMQQTLDEFSENTLSNFYIPFGVIPEVMINEKIYCVPMAIEESSVVAAASKSCKFWLERGGFKAEVIKTKKTGQVHFFWQGNKQKLFHFFHLNKEKLLKGVRPLQENMRKRGGGIEELSLLDKTSDLSGYFQLSAIFETFDAMGANFINTILEALAKSLKEQAVLCDFFDEKEKDICVVMSILSNYTPDCLVRCYVECPISLLADKEWELSAEDFVEKFIRAVEIAGIDPFRACTHNKGIFNGIDGVVMATGNDFRAIEAAGHAYASRSGQYKGLTSIEVKDGLFKYQLELPLAVGVVGGLTRLHPLARLSLELLGRPSAKRLMTIIASIGLAQNFAAISSLVTTGIQKGHMKMHLLNILTHLEASKIEQDKAKDYFKDRIISFRDVRNYLAGMRNYER